MQGELFFDDFASPWRPPPQRLAVCMALGTVIMLLVLTLLDWPSPATLVRLIPPVLEVTLERAPAARERADVRTEMPPAAAPAVPAEPAETEPPAATEQPATEQPERALPQSQPAEQPAAAAQAGAPSASAAPVSATTSAPVDWYIELARVAAEIGARAAAEPQSMHPEFDELRRVAKLRYGKPQTNPPPPTWEVVKDPYGRKILKNGPFFKVLDDLRLFNQYAFEHFERHMLFVSIPLGRPKPKNLPWVETIRARYPYFLEPDELPPLKATPTEQSPDP